MTRTSIVNITILVIPVSRPAASYYPSIYTIFQSLFISGFLDRGLLITINLPSQGFLLIRLNPSFPCFYWRYQTLLTSMEYLCQITTNLFVGQPVLLSFFLFHDSSLDFRKSSTSNATSIQGYWVRFVVRFVLLNLQCFVHHCLSFARLLPYFCQTFSIYGFCLPFGIFRMF